MSPPLQCPTGVELVEASAGTGKTHRITDLLVLLVTEGALPIERVLIVTFTRNATAELRDRVRTRLARARSVLAGDEAAPPDDGFLCALPARAAADPQGAHWVRRLRRALLDFDAAGISTIHGFCQTALHDNALASHVEPGLAFVGDSGPAVAAIARDVWTGLTWELDPALLVRLHADAWVTEGALVSIGTELLRAPRASLEPPLTAPVLPDAAALRAQASALLAACHSNGPALQAKLAIHAAAMLKAYQVDGVQAHAEALVGWLSRYEPLKGGVKSVRGLTRPAILAGRRAPTKARPQVAEAAITTPLCDAIEAFLDLHEAFAVAFKAFQRALRRQFADTLLLRLTERKQRRHVQSYGDLLVDLAAALDAPGTAATLRASLRARYGAALIDEFQDTDPVQWAIFMGLFAGSALPPAPGSTPAPALGSALPLVLVGDEKQAIYSFRGADVAAYRDARATVTSHGSLAVNQRSDERLVLGVNHLFGRARPPLAEPFLDPRVPFIPASPKHPLRLHFANRPDRPPLELRLLQDPSPDAPRLGGPAARGLVGEWLAHDVEALIAEAPSLTVDGVTRPLRAHDIAVLVRTHLHGQAAQDALTARGIPSVRHSQDDVLRSTTSRALRRLLVALLDPAGRGRAGAALVSELFGLGSDALARLQADEPAWDAQIEELRRWSALWHDKGIGAALRVVFDDRQVLPRLLAQPGGARQVVDLQHIVELLHGAERSEHRKPTALLRWFERAIAGVKAGDEEDGPDDRLLKLETDADAVQIVTIHACKGLQYPVVFATSLWDAKLLDARDRKQLRYRDAGRTVLDLEPAKPDNHAGVLQATDERAAEEMRLVYVALTRARHRVVVYWGAFKGIERAAMSWLLHEHTGASGRAGRDALAARLKPSERPDLGSDLQTIADGAPRSIELSVCTGSPAPRTSGAPPPAPPAPFVPFGPRLLDSWWRLSSFSAMAGHGRAASPQAGEEQPEFEGVNREPEDEAAPHPSFGDRDHVDPARSLPLAFLPPGKTAGNCLHAILEHHDFQAPHELRERVRSQLVAHGFSEEEETDRVTAGLDAALRTPLPGVGIALASVPRADRLDELEFHLGVATGGGVVGRSALAAVIAAHPTPVLPAGYHEQFGRKQFLPLKGLLKGTIDLVFRHEGRYYLADYKSSWMGFAAADYSPAAMHATMQAHDYHLQYLIYGAALHRFLQQRVAGYSYPRHFGGSYYLFLRGMTPDAPAPRGIVYDPMNEGLVEGLARALTTGGGVP